MRRWIGCGLLWSLCGCAATGKLTGTGNSCGTADTGQSPDLLWTSLPQSDTAGLFPFPKPLKYELYAVRPEQVRRFFAFFRALPEDSSKAPDITLSVPLPHPVNCRRFSVRQSDVLSPALRQKYPDLIALRGTNPEAGGDLRLEYDGEKMKGQVLWQGQVFLLEPLQKDNGYVYLVYTKEDAGRKKRMFEPADKEGRTSDNSNY